MLRAALYEKVRQNAGSKIRLTDMIPFAWQRARIITHFQSRIRLPDCPFNWDLSRRERRQMMAEAQLNVIAFATREGNRVIDFNNEIIAFDLRETTLTPQQAVFIVERKAADLYCARPIKEALNKSILDFPACSRQVRARKMKMRFSSYFKINDWRQCLVINFGAAHLPAAGRPLYRRKL